jgi:hypothetical protein
MTTTELRDTSPHATDSTVTPFGSRRSFWKGTHVKPYIPRKAPLSVQFIGFLGYFITMLSAVCAAVAVAYLMTGNGLNAAISAVTGGITLIIGPCFLTAYHVAKSSLRIDDMTAHKLSHGE